MSGEYHYWQCCSNIFLEDCPEGSSVFNPHPPLFLPSFLLSFWQPIIFQPLSSFPPSSQLKLNKHFLTYFIVFSPSWSSEQAVWTSSGKVLLLGGCLQSGLKSSVSAGTAYRLLCSGLRCAQCWESSKNLNVSKHQPSCSTPNTKSVVAERRSWGTLVSLLLPTSSLTGFGQTQGTRLSVPACFTRSEQRHCNVQRRGVPVCHPIRIHTAFHPFTFSHNR